MSKLLSAVCREYGFCDYVNQPNISNNLSQIRCHLKGSSGPELFLKEKPSYVVNPHFIFHLLLHNYSMSENSPVPTIYKTKSGLLWIQLQNRKFELQEWINGNPPIPFCASDFERVGELLALFQISIRNFNNKWSGNWFFPPNRACISPERDFEILNYTKFLNDGLTRLGKSDFGLVEIVREIVKKAGCTIQTKTCPQQFIHGDCDLLNCMKTESGKLFLIDLDLAHWGYKLSDVAFMAATICGMEYSPSSGYHIGKKWHSDIEGKLLRGYERYLPLTEHERDCLDSFLRLNLVRAFIGCLDLDNEKPVIAADLREQAETLCDILSRF